MKFTNIELITIVIAFLAVLIPAIALVVTIKQYRNQLRLNFFADYTKRYQEIMLNFPISINSSDFNFDNLNLDVKERILVYMRAYFDLCSEEYYLSNDRKIDEKIWKEWKSGIEYTFSKKAFQDGWKIVNLDSKFYGEFVKWVEDEVLIMEV